MSNFPILSGKELIKILNKIGYHKIRQCGSHVRLKCVGKKPATIPNYKTIDRSLEFKKLLKK